MVWRHAYNAASVHVESASSLSLPFLSLLFFLLYIFFTHIFSLFLFIFFFSLFSFLFSMEEPAPSLVRNEPITGCSPISPTLGLLCLTTPKAKCVMSVSLSVSHQLGVPSVQSVWFSYSQAPYVPCSFNPNLEMVSDKNTRRCILTREHVLSFYWFSIKFFLLFFKSSGYLPVVLVYGHKLDHGRFSGCSHDW